MIYKAEIEFLTVEDVMKLTGYSKPTVLEIFNRKDFPVWTYGRQFLVEKNAFLKYAESGCRREL